MTPEESPLACAIFVALFVAAGYAPDLWAALTDRLKTKRTAGAATPTALRSPSNSKH